MHIFRPHAREHKPSGAYVVEVDVFGAGVGYLAPLTHQGHPAYTPLPPTSEQGRGCGGGTAPPRPRRAGRWRCFAGSGPAGKGPRRRAPSGGHQEGPL